MIDINGRSLKMGNDLDVVDQYYVMYNASRPIDLDKHDLYVNITNDIVNIFTRSKGHLSHDNVIYYGYMDKNDDLNISSRLFNIYIITFNIDKVKMAYDLHRPVTTEHPARIIVDEWGYRFIIDDREFRIEEFLKFNHYVDGDIQFIKHFRQQRLISIENHL